MLKKSLALLLCLVLCVSLFAACNNDSDTSSTPAGDTDTSASTPADDDAALTGGKLTFWTFQNAHNTFMEKRVEAWNGAHPEAQIEWEGNVYSFDDNHNNLLIALQSGTGAPDIVDIEIGAYANYLKGDIQLLPLNSITDNYDDIVMSRLNLYEVDGNFYGLDYHVGAEVMYYNKELTDAAGINIDEIATWDDYMAAGKTFKAANADAAWTTLEIQEHWSAYPLIIMAGGEWMDADGNLTLDSEINAEVLQTLYDMMTVDGTAVAAPGGFHHAEEYYAFMNDGGAASIWMPAWYLNRFTDYMPDLSGKIIMTPMPAWKEGGARSMVGGGTGTSITKQCQNPDLALAFLDEGRLSDEGCVETWKELAFDPIRTSVWSSDAMKEENRFTEYFLNGVDLFEVLAEVKDEILPINVGELYPATQTAFQKSVVFNVFSENMAPADALKAAQDEINAAA